MGRDREGVENKTKFYVSSRDVRIVCPRLDSIMTVGKLRMKSVADKNCLSTEEWRGELTYFLKENSWG